MTTTGPNPPKDLHHVSFVNRLPEYVLLTLNKKNTLDERPRARRDLVSDGSETDVGVEGEVTRGRSHTRSPETPGLDVEKRTSERDIGVFQ